MSNENLQHKAGRLASAMRMYVSAMRFMAGTIMGSIVIIMVVQVIARYVFNSSLIWAEELCRYLLIWMTFLLLGMSYRSGGLIAVDVVPLMLPPPSATRSAPHDHYSHSDVSWDDGLVWLGFCFPL